MAALTTQRRILVRQPVSYASGIINLDTCKEIARTDGDNVIHVEDLDILPVSAAQGTGRPSWASLRTVSPLCKLGIKVIVVVSVVYLM